MIFTPSRPGHQRLEELRSLDKWIYTIRQHHMDMGKKWQKHTQNLMFGSFCWDGRTHFRELDVFSGFSSISNFDSSQGHDGRSRDQLGTGQAGATLVEQEIFKPWLGHR